MMMDEEPESKESESHELVTEEMLMDCSISLHLACVLGRVRLVKQLLAECPAIINAMSSVHKLTAVHVAAKHGHEEVLDLLLARSPELVVAKSSEDRTPLHFAAENGHDKIVEKLLAHSPGLLNAQDSDLKTALHLAIERGHDLVVAQLMRFNPNFELKALVDDEDDDDKKRRKYETKSAVYLAVEKGHEKIVALLLANPDVALGKEDNMERTPLHLAAASGLDPIVALLLAREPSAADVRDCRGDLALHHAIEAGHTNIVAQLLAHSPATVHAVNNKQESALHFAAERGSVEIAELLLAANASIDVVDQCKASALHRAVDSGSTELVALLLARKALVTDDRDGKNKPLIFRPVFAGHSQIVAMLLAHSPHLLDARTKPEGMNALHFATDPAIVQQLLSLNPALLEEHDQNGRSPLYTAVKDNRDKVVAQMLAQCRAADVFQGRITNILALAFTMSHEPTLEALLANKPELIHVKLISGMLLHCVLSARLSQAFVTKVWEMNKQAVHEANLAKETPFHIALSRGLDWAIEMMQGQLSFDQIAEACKQTQTSQDRFRPVIEQLSADVTEVVCEYLGFESASKRVGKRARDD